MQAFYAIPEITQSFKDGFEAGTHMGEKAAEQDDKNQLLIGEEIIPTQLVLRPDRYDSIPDSLYNTKTGEYIPVNFDRITVESKREIHLVEYIFIFLVSLLYAGGLITAFISFIRLLLAINKSVIFEWKNVKRLRWIGTGFIVAFICNFIVEYVNYDFASNQFLISNYKISFITLLKNVNLVFGFISLLLAEVFANGLRMKEQQELTI